MSFVEITGVTGTGEFDPLTGQYMPGTGDIGTISPGYPLPFCFAWVDPGTPFDDSLARVDEEILSIELKHEEGQIPTLEIEIKNPRIGLLNANRKQWAWLSYQPPLLDPFAPGTYVPPTDGIPAPVGGTPVVAPTTEGTPEYVVDGYVLPGYQVYDGAQIPVTPPPETPTPFIESPITLVPPVYTNGYTIIPLFFGELVGVPSNLFAEKLTLRFIARPMDYIAQKQAVAETLKNSTNYDPVFIQEAKRDDPDAILEGWSKLYHVDRVTNAVSASDVLVGEDGMVFFPESPPSALYDSLSLKIGQAPLTNVQVQAKVHWTQRCIGYVPGPDVNVSSYTGSTFASDWMALSGKSIGAGWTVESAYVVDPFLVAHTPTWHISTQTTFYGILAQYDCSIVSESVSQSGPALLGSAMSATKLTKQQIGYCNPTSIPPTNIPLEVQLIGVYIPLWVLNCTWTLRYNAKREFTEMAVIDVTANTQAILTSPTVEQDTALIKVNGEVGQPLLVYDAWTDFMNSSVTEGQLIWPNNPVTPGGLSYQLALNSGIAGSVEPIFSDVPGQPPLSGLDNEIEWISLGEDPLSAVQRMTFATSYNTGTILEYIEQVFDLNSGTLVDVPGSGSFYVCTQECSTTSVYTEYTYQPPLTESDQILFPPALASVFVMQFAPVTGMVPVTLPSIPVGGTVENVTARCYFPTARGQQSLTYCVNRARAKIRLRSRAVDIGWDCPFDLVVGMSCRMNSTIYDSRLPGGLATGKVTSYTLNAKGGKMWGHVQIGCAVGYNVFGNPEADFSLTPAIFQPFDDGLNFPLVSLPSDGGLFSQSLIDQEDAIGAAMGSYLTAQALLNPPTPPTPPQEGSGGEISVLTGVLPSTAWTAAVDQAELPTTMESNSRGWSMEIMPVTNGPFSGAYTIFVTPLELPMGINLQADSEE